MLMGCIAGNYLKYLRPLGDMFLLPIRVQLREHTVTLGMKLGEGGAADVYRATEDVSIPGSQPGVFALKKVWQHAQTRA